VRDTILSTKNEINGLTYKIVGAAIEVYKALGPGLLESPISLKKVHELM